MIELTQDHISELIREEFDMWLSDAGPMSATVKEKCEEAFHSGWHFGRSDSELEGDTT
jgi:hypothetical protein